MALLVRNGTIVNADGRVNADVRCDDGKVTAVGPGLTARAGDTVIDAAGACVMPGFIDPHVHLDLAVGDIRSADDFESGTASAVAGGTTTVIDFVTPARGESLLAALEARRAEAARAVCDWSLHMSVLDWDARTADEMARVVEAGVTSFKVYLAYKGALQIDDAGLYEVMKRAATLDAVVLVHAENGDAVAALQRDLVAAGDTGPEFHPVSRPPCVEAEATGRALMMARLHGTRVYIVHMTCHEAVEALARAKQRGQPCHGETCPQYLVLDDRVFSLPGFEGAAYVLSPAIRPVGQGHHEALWAALADGTLDTVATDHCPFLFAHKRRGEGDFTRIPNGAPGIEDRPFLVHTHGVVQRGLSLERMVEIMSTAPARIFGLHPRKGVVAVGADADLVVWDPAATGTRSVATHHSRADRNLYEGFATRGAPARVIVGGRVVAADGRLDVTRGAGRFLARTPGRHIPRMAGTVEMGRIG
jgi:dihydropyrimidinase